MTARSSKRHHGLAVVGAIVLIGLTGVAFVALASFVRQDFRRTTQARGEAQLRQLLLAGESLAAASLDQSGREVRSVALPAELSADGATLTLTPGDVTAEAKVVDVDAACMGLRSSQRLTYQRQDGKWVLARADLSPTSALH